MASDEQTRQHQLDGFILADDGLADFGPQALSELSDIVQVH
jgi:hypothetical protein